MDARTISLEETKFRPEVFFLGRTEGSGIVRDPLGRIVRRCRIVTEGAVKGQNNAIQLDETFTYDDGEVDVWRWAITHGRDGRYLAAEESAGPGIAGVHEDGDYVLRFRRPMKQASGVFAPSFRTRFTLLSPDLALKSVRVSLMGLPLGVMTAVHRRVKSPPARPSLT